MSVAMKTARARAYGGRMRRGRPMGDPGLWGFLGKVGKTVASNIPGVGPAIDIASSAISMTKGLASNVPKPGIALPFAGGFPSAPSSTALAPYGGGTQLACPSGYHPNRSAYWLKDGTRIEKGTRCVKNRRSNPANARALSRAIHRIDGGKRLQATLREIETGRYTKAGKKKN